ncbi:hypothetical protein AVEN_270726-1 [Araneus ventricosus]|uniref:DUF19 domain-containing protein n=1 Tax=Araneus ventricosus TaxID=182803 RepID=A0A4Y2JNK5_ARAVE|nr:hypothetical protein AVEN_270726-1 [Araneus ventricosus]
MWSAIFITLGLCYGALARGDGVCLLQAERDCRVYSIFPSEFPTNLEELRNDCSNLYRVKRCIADRNCSTENADDYDNEYRNDYEDRNRDKQRVKDMQRLIDVTSQICDENSELHRNFVPYLSCVRSAMEIDFEHQACRDYTKNAIEFLRSRIESKARMASGDEKKIEEVRYELMGCLRVLFGMNCFIIQSAKSCDSGVKQPILEIIGKGGSLYYQCPASSRIDVIELLDALKLVTRQKIHIKELIRVDSLF